jgi:hypothetical protein
LMADYGDGWFKVSRRIFDSSRWYGEDPATVKVMFFLIGYAQDPMIPEPGVIPLSDRALAARTGLTEPEVTKAIDALAAEDPASRSHPENGGSRKTVERIPGGVRLMNFEMYQPGLVQNARIKAEERSAKARAAAAARWEKVRREKGGDDDV